MAKVNETAVGLLFFGALIGMGALTIFLSDFSLFEKKYDVTVLFDDASGLEEGDNVLVMGTIQGKVHKLDFFRKPRRTGGGEANHWVEVTLRMDIPLDSYLNTGYKIRIRNSNFLGSKVVDVELGEEGAALAGGAVLSGKSIPDPLEEISDLISENRDKVDSSIENFERFTRDLTAASASLNSGDGILNTLLNDKVLADRVTDFVSSASRSADDLGEIIGQVKQGEGALGRIVFDKEWAEEVVAMLASVKNSLGWIEETTEHVKAGRGPLGYILFNEEAERDIGDMIGNISDFTTTVRSGEGTLGMLLYDKETGSRVKNLIADAGDAVSRIGEMVEFAQSGGGALGFLLYDKNVRAELEALLDQALLAMEDAREAAPLSSLGSFLFGTF